MPRNQRPSFLKRQKEQQRKARAEQKRENRNARRAGSLAGNATDTDNETPAESGELNDKEP